MLQYPHIDPVMVRIGPLALRWYGMMYLLGFVAGYFNIRLLARRRGLALDGDTLSDMLFWCVCGVILGGRLGYTLIYNGAYYFAHPIKIFYVWEGGMSFHGGMLGVALAIALFCRRRGLPFLLTGDVVAAATPIGLGLGRIGNFINGELWGRVTDVPWAMVFPGGGPLPRHPSQLYEAILEGPVLWLILWALHRRKAPPGTVIMVFFLGYGLFRFTVEFFRQPDAQLGFLWGGATMGQLLSLPMIIGGALGLVWVLGRRRRA